ncbi:hypothetical protein [Duganella violaceipulchra]|uniref:DUF1488 family protein n=1 Tax=Duganella violaceipulchra TaxID=2849652 RepID=A0AA41HAA0_9BURK|nr:hypothetical protein [Duganella violaceicalia]MBV6324907.1 hypothetical protein [Duganella violaceicalia]MCP2012345.1 hypothetical protein [Duganella violaceicalia]
MDTTHSIIKEHLSGDEERVEFSFRTGTVDRHGYISRSALLQLDGPAGHDLMWIFTAHRQLIAEAALAYVTRHPMAGAIALGSNDF